MASVDNFGVGEASRGRENGIAGTRLIRAQGSSGPSNGDLVIFMGASLGDDEVIPVPTAVQMWSLRDDAESAAPEDDLWGETSASINVDFETVDGARDGVPGGADDVGMAVDVEEEVWVDAVEVEEDGVGPGGEGGVAGADDEVSEEGPLAVDGLRNRVDDVCADDVGCASVVADGGRVEAASADEDVGAATVNPGYGAGEIELRGLVDGVAWGLLGTEGGEWGRGEGVCSHQHGSRWRDRWMSRWAGRGRGGRTS
jgi:hypothetical protein